VRPSSHLYSKYKGSPKGQFGQFNRILANNPFRGVSQWDNVNIKIFDNGFLAFELVIVSAQGLI
jgi:hypothetical protein